MTINANFTGMSNPNQSILFLSNSCGMLLPGPWRKPPASWNLDKLRFSGSFKALLYNIIISSRLVKSPGEIFLADFCQLPVKHSPGRARCVAVPTQKPRTSAIYYWGSLGV